MNFLRIVLSGASTYSNSSNSYIVLLSWGGAFTLQDASANNYSGSVVSNTASNNFFIIPPNFNLVSTTAFFASAVEMSFKELTAFLGVQG